jgi:hypothetical protein
MPTPPKRTESGRFLKKNSDPAIAHNERILAARQERIIQKEVAETMDLGLGLKAKPPESAAELLEDEFDKKAFGARVKTTTRIVYGPDPIVQNCPEFHERLERYGQENVADAFRELIMTKGEMACPDSIMRKAVRNSIAQFGKEATATAFRDRIMRIPSRTVEIELDDALDPLLVNPMRAAVERYITDPGMAPKFLSAACIDVLGLRGYTIVKDERGDAVKVGTLILAQIPKEWAERRRLHFAKESMDAVAEQEEAFMESAEREIRSEGGRGIGASPLRPGESVTADPALNDLYTGGSRSTGINQRTV